jgi:hypothetical protein
MKPELKPPGTKRLKLKCDALFSTCASKFNLRCYVLAWEAACQLAGVRRGQGE